MSDPKNKKFIAAIITLAGVALIGSIIVFVTNENPKHLKITEREDLDVEIYHSPSKDKALTVLLHTVDRKDAIRYLYVLGTENKNDDIKDESFYLRFPIGCGLYIEWVNDQLVNIYSDKPPEINTFSPNQFKINFYFGRKYLDDLILKGKKIIRHRAEGSSKVHPSYKDYLEKRNTKEINDSHNKAN